MTAHPARTLVDSIADGLAHPDTAPIGTCGTDWRRQSLAHGLPGIALLHVELAAAELTPWQRAHDWLTAATRLPLTSGRDSHPYYGAPALAHALACAAERLPGAYERTLDVLDRQLIADTRRRLETAHHRIEGGHLPALAEFDAIRGLTGYGAYLLRRDPASNTVRSVLDYLVHLTKPLSHHGEELPGWWTGSGPSGRLDHRFPDGHANMGVAHGIAGVLGLLSLAAQKGTVVDGQHDAIRMICAWMDQWQTDTGQGPAWPYWVTRAELRTGHPHPYAAQRPSWCYGTSGLARMQQLAALALRDSGRQEAAENALISALTDRAQLAVTTDVALCHGFAGLAHIAARAADDALPSTTSQLRALIPALLSVVHPPGTDAQEATTRLLQAQDTGPGLLDGAAGIALATLAPSTAAPPHSAWDACLLTA
ncbi:lanthionine synthetase C family protein [Streptomyces albidochromogenes]|uniref:lanthionine synthetase C family protein n=1 Tax=Streptomyces albidochromogenes TaxID=329524 RepID=UPI00110F96AF|nr:lanthionine synthetase C family protein [Streptomyces albidochromogenes]